MSIKYRVVKINSINGNSPFQIAPVFKDYIDEEYLADSICKSSSFTRGDVLGVIDAICTEIATAIDRGKLVRIRKLGVIKAKLGSRERPIPEYCPSTSVYLKGLTLIWSQEFKDRIIDTKTERAKEYIDVHTVGKDIRLNNILRAARESEYIRTSEMQRINKSCLSTTVNDLKELCEEKKIERIARGVYRLTAE